MKPTTFLLIQTAFTGDVVLATGLIEKLKSFYPNAEIDFMVRKGNEGLFTGHPHLRKLWVWNKKQRKYKGLLSLIRQFRQQHYDYVINLQRFATTGLVTVLSGARKTIGFDKNPFSRLFTVSMRHMIGDGRHEMERNHDLIRHLTDTTPAKPKLYPQPGDYQKVKSLKERPFVCIAPTSVWFTKQFPEAKWVALIRELPESLTVYLLGGPDDAGACEKIREAAGCRNVVNVAGTLSLLASAALMQDARMNYVNDSAPMHLASATNAPVCAVYCSTVPAFGFGPLSDVSFVVQRQEPLYCRPCGLHGHQQCPEGHFKCAKDIETKQLVEAPGLS